MEQALQSGTNKVKRAWAWVPSMYFAQGLPYTIVIMLAPTLFKNLNMGNAANSWYASWLYLPWVLKALWSPFVDNVGTKRRWVLATQMMLSIGLLCLGLSMPFAPNHKLMLVALWVIAFSSATHDIATDGFYMYGLNSHGQSFFVGIRNTAYRLAMLSGTGALVYLMGSLQEGGLSVRSSWMWGFYGVAVLFVSIAIYHVLVLPKPKTDVKRKVRDAGNAFQAFGDAFLSFFRKPKIWVSILFILLYRFGEAQLSRMTAPFLLDDRALGGLAISLKDQGFIYGTVGTVGMVLGGILGGLAAAKHGFKFWIWPMVMSLNLPNLVYVYLAYAQPDNLGVVGALVVIEQFGYGFGFTAFTLFLLQFCDGGQKTSHYAIATGIMGLGMMVPGLFAGWVQEQIGYFQFFIYVMVCTLPGILMIPFLPINSNFGKENS